LLEKTTLVPLSDSTDEQALLNFLRQADSSGEKAEIRQTHISIVALTPTHAYKIKKPVQLGFLDSSTPEKRRAACEAKVRLNRHLRSNPGIVLRGRPVLRLLADQ
jgi:aminoglycoside phosphotransferase family enzyme